MLRPWGRLRHRREALVFIIALHAIEAVDKVLEKHLAALMKDGMR
jgi:hypothetical protein